MNFGRVRAAIIIASPTCLFYNLTGTATFYVHADPSKAMLVERILQWYYNNKFLQKEHIA